MMIVVRVQSFVYIERFKQVFPEDRLRLPRVQCPMAFNVSRSCAAVTSRSIFAAVICCP